MSVSKNAAAYRFPRSKAGRRMLWLRRAAGNSPLLPARVGVSLRLLKGNYPSNRMLAKLRGPFRRLILPTRIFWRGAPLAWLLCPGIDCAATGGGAAAGAADVDAARLEAADSEPQNWFTGGRDKDGTYYSPLASIDAKNIERLGFAWQYDLG